MNGTTFNAKSILEKYDSAPVQNSTNLITSGAVYSATSVLAVKASYVNATLSASLWSGSSAPYTYDLSVPGLKAAQVAELQIANGSTFAQRSAARDAMIDVSGQFDGAITLVADGDKPSIDIPVTIILFG